MESRETIELTKRLAVRLIKGQERIATFGEAEFFLRLAVLPSRMRRYFVVEDEDTYKLTAIELLSLVNEYSDHDLSEPEILDFLETQRDALEYSTRMRATTEVPLDELEQPKLGQGIPSMISEITQKYYLWLGQNFPGRGEFVELGCWLGSSTASLVEGLQTNPNFSGKVLHVYDSFNWARWMAQYVPASFVQAHSLRWNDSFLPLFWSYCEAFRDRLRVVRSCIPLDEVENELPAISWEGSEIGTLVYDLSDEYRLVERFWEIFSPSFVDGYTTIVFQQYGNSESIRAFCRDHDHELSSLHKPWGTPKSFRFQRC